MASKVFSFFPAPMPEKSSGLFRSLEGDLLHPNARKVFRSPECDLLHSHAKNYILVPWARPGLLPGARLYGMEECKMSHYREWKTFPAFGTHRVFWHGGMWKRSMGGGKNVMVSTAGLSILGNGIFWWEVKTKRLFHSVGTKFNKKYI